MTKQQALKQTQISLKKLPKRFTSSEKITMFLVLVEVFNSLKKDETTETYVDNGRITLSIEGHRMYDLRQCINKLYEQISK